jgi:diacylglycerol kinase (ATP)
VNPAEVAAILPSRGRHRPGWPSGNVPVVLSDYAGWVAFGAIILVLLLALLVAGPWRATDAGAEKGAPRRFGRRRPPRDHFRPEGAPPPDPEPERQAAIIVNPTKFDNLEAVRAQVTKACRAEGWAQPLWIETTVQDPGTGQARYAVEQGVTIVCALGGDGTVRAVAAALVGTETPMGLLPGGTGNLLARNLSLPVDSLDDAVRVALTGQNKRVDVGTLTVEPEDTQEKPKDHVFLVMAGLGFDAAIMAGAPEKLKARVGWLAYTVSGMRNLRGPRFKIRMAIEDQPDIERRVRTVVIGNCGKLTGGLVLMPEAELDDGWLDCVLLSPGGLIGWMAVAVRVLSQRRKGHERVDHQRAQSLTIRTDRPEQVQLDGDPIGEAKALRAAVRPLALVVRVG